jgi:hypothetical protein
MICHSIKLLSILAVIAGAVAGSAAAIGAACALYMLIDVHEGGWRPSPPTEPPPGTPAVRISHSVGHRSRKL